ncbi:peptidase [Aureococcus anophagefferens]|nr:peptidase [Aureococcus anophagefferens]
MMRNLFLLPAAVAFKRGARVLPRVRGGALSSTATAQHFIDDVNAQYEALHTDFEAQFWGTKMALSTDHEPLSGPKRACYDGLRSIGSFVVEHGFVELVKKRNAMAKALGYVDYYDYKVTQAEGFGKAQLFGMLDELERASRPIMEAARETLAADKGADALEPWNRGFAMAGDITRKLDPYFPLREGRASMDLDLLDRKGKYSNGFCHWPQPAWRRSDGSWQPAVTHFTSLADPSAVGSGMTGLVTLMHEAGHAAHFANTDVRSPLFSQERAPTSVPYAELQSMFLDSLVGDAAWRGTYAKSRGGDVVPWALLEEDLTATHPYKVLALRSMLSVPYFEKALYEMADEDLTAASAAAAGAPSRGHRGRPGPGPCSPCPTC